MGEACFDDVCIAGVIVDMEWVTGIGWRWGRWGARIERDGMTRQVALHVLDECAVLTARNGQSVASAIQDLTAKTENMCQ